VASSRSPDKSGLEQCSPEKSSPTKALLSAAVVLVGVAMIAITSLALFTDSASVPANTFNTGTIDINTSPTTALLAMSAMVPGDQVTATLTVSNNGTLQLRYAVTSTTTEDALAAQLVLTVKSGVTTCNSANWSASGTTLYSGLLGSTTTAAIVGSVATGSQAGDRTLAASSSEVFCLNVTLPLNATLGSGAATTATLNFQAEQTSNNP
jgi:spore coat-associated protein N